MDYQNKLKQLVENTDGAVGSFFCGYDGIIIDQYKPIGQQYELEYVAANFSTICKKLIHEENMLKDFFATFEHNIVAVSPVDEDGFVGIVLSSDGNVGRAKFELNKCRREFEK